jgi:D-sedoheptulose 7-phosphate isomerase|tara:strand:- start:680 stop:1276 length:597 start_codon:yes stop_codon:yes gene_type:complete
MKNKQKHIDDYFNKISIIARLMDKEKINKIVLEILNLKKKKGRLFFIGVGGSAANASHAVNDFRKLCGIESYSPIDNVSELTARINDEGWENSFIDWLKVSKLNSSDGIFIFSVGGGNKKKGISTNLIKAVDYAKKQKTKVFGIVGRNDGYVYKKGNLVLQVPLVSKNLLTPFSESFQAVVWHCLVSDPRLQINKTKW